MLLRKISAKSRAPSHYWLCSFATVRSEHECGERAIFWESDSPTRASNRFVIEVILLDLKPRFRRRLILENQY